VQRIGAVFANAAHRGRAGEIVLENLLEAGGMGRHRDFEVQATLSGGGSPDVVLTLPGRGRLFIDAKFPLDDFQRARAAATDKKRRKALAAHGKAVASHVSQLAKRDYPAQLPDAMDFLVCYVPSEELLAAAYDAARDGVLIAGPATLLSILWGIAHGLQQDARARHGQEIGESAAELHRRLGTLVPDLQKLGNS
jgi:DNA recombination protein RmuC